MMETGRDRERERERESRWALIVDGKRLHVFDGRPPEWVDGLTRLKGIRIEEEEERKP
jgi:hypothetical protein